MKNETTRNEGNVREDEGKFQRTNLLWRFVRCPTRLGLSETRFKFDTNFVNDRLKNKSVNYNICCECFNLLQ